MKKIIFLLIFIIPGLISSCDSYLDINGDPNSPSEEDVTSSMIFPGAEMNIATGYGDYMRIVGGYFSQQYAQQFGTSNYLDYSEFNMSATRSSSTYSQLNTHGLLSLNTIKEKSTENEEWGTYLAATTLRVFVIQSLVDAYGEIPYTEALDVTNLSPKYDEGEDVYAGIIAELDSALDKVSGSEIVCTNFLFGSTSVDNWVKFANALKLKLLMRESNVKDVESELAALIGENNFPTEDISWDDCWTDEKGAANPFYQEDFASYFATQVNLIANLAYMKTMTDSNDARRDKFFETNDDGDYTGGISGSYFSTSDKYKAAYFCRPVASYDMPVYLINVFEIDFFKAEYYARYGSADDAEKYYKAGIEASFETSGLDVSDAESIYTTSYPYDNGNYKELIGIQKWIALGGTNNFEAWCELRRLDFPKFTDVKGSDIYDEANDNYDPSKYTAGTLYTPITVNSELGDNQLLERFKYAESSTSRNSNAPDNKLGNVPVFWAK